MIVDCCLLGWGNVTRSFLIHCFYKWHFGRKRTGLVPLYIVDSILTRLEFVLKKLPDL